MDCKITTEQQRKLRRIVAHDLFKKIEAGEDLNLNDYMRSMYDSIKNATDDHAKSLAYVRFIPEMMIQLAARERKTIGKYLRPDLSSLYDVAEKYDTQDNPLDKVAEDLGIAPDPSNNDFSNNGVKSKREEAKKKRKEKKPKIDNTPVEPVTSGTFLQNIGQKVKDFFTELWRAWAPTALSDWAYETELGTNVPITKGNTQLMFKIKRNLLNYLKNNGDKDSNEIDYDGWGPVTLTAMSVSQIEDRLGEEIDLSFDPDRNGVFLVLTNRFGEPMTFNEEGMPAYEGKIGYFQMRKVEDHINEQGEYKPSKAIRQEDNKRIAAIAKVREITESEARAQYISELNALHKIREYVLKNKEENTVPLVVNGGSLGFIRQDINNPAFRKPLANSPQQMRFKLANESDANSGLGMKEGFTYFFVDEMLGQPLQVERPMVDGEFNGVEMLSNLLVEDLLDQDGNPVSLSERIRLTKQYLYLSDYGKDSDLDIKFPTQGETNHRLKIGASTYKLNTPQERQIAKERLQKFFTDLTPQSFVTRETLNEVRKPGSQRNIVTNKEGATVNDILKTSSGYYSLGKRKLHVSNELILDPGNEIDLVTITQNEDGTYGLATEKQNYHQFVKENFYGSAEISGDGRYRKAGAYFTFSLSNEAEKTLYPEQSEEEDTTIERNEEAAESIESSPVESAGNNEVSPEDIINQTLESNKEEDKNEDDDQYLKIRRVKESEQKATKKQIEEARKWYENHPMREYIDFEPLFHLVNNENPNAVATWTMAGIILYQGSDYSDLYHESWHGFSQAFMSPKQRRALYLEVANKEGTFVDHKGRTVYFADPKYSRLAKKKKLTAAEREYVEAKELQYEEWLAEEFRNYMLNGQKPVAKSPKVNSLFQRIWNFLKALFTDSTSYGIMLNAKADKAIGEVFEKLKTGQLQEYSFSYDNASFNQLDFGISALETREGVEALNHENSAKISQTLDALFSEFIEIMNSGLTLEERAQYREITSRLTNGYYKKLSKDEAAEVMAEDKALKERLESKATYKYTTKIVKDKEFRMQAYKYALAKMKTIRDNIQEKLNQETSDIKKNQMHKDIRLLDFAISEFGVKTEDGKLAELDANAPVPGKTPKGVIGYHMVKSKVFQDQMVKLDFEDMTETEANVKGRSSVDSDRRGNGYSLKELAKSEIVYLITGLSEYDSDGQKSAGYFGRSVPKLANFQAVWNRLARLLQNTTKIDNMYHKLQAEAEINPQIAELLRKLGPIQSDNANLNALWTSFWQTFNKTRIPLIQLSIKKNKHGGYVYTAGEAFNADYQVGKNWQGLFEKAVEGESKYILKDKAGSYLNLEAVLEDFPKDNLTKRQFEFFNAIGFKLSDVKELKDELAANPTKYAASHFRSVILSLKNSDTKVRSLDQITADENAPFKALQQLESRYSDVFSNFMVTNAEGNTQFEHSLNNTVSQMVNAINEAETYEELISQRHMAHLNIENNPFSEASIWMKSLFDLSGTPETNENYGNKKKKKNGEFVRLRLTNLSGTFFEDSQGTRRDGVASAKADEYTKFIMDLHLSYAGFPELMRHADKGTSYSVSIEGPIFEGATNQYIPAYLFAGADHTYMTKTYDKLIPHIVAEMRRMRMIRDMQDTDVYDHNYLDKGKYFTTFNDVLTDDTVTALEALIEDDTLNVEKSAEAYMTRIKQSPGIRELIQNDLKNYFDKQFDKAWGRFQEAGFTANNLIADIRAKARKGGVQINEVSKAQEALVRSMVHNQWIHNIESISLLYGDLALYNHAKEEFHKRNAGMGSTGTLYRTDSIIQNFINNSIFETSYVKASLERLRMNMEDVKSYDGTFHTAVVQDQNIGSVYFDEYVNELVKEGLTKKEARALLEPYDQGKMTEADAQGLITFDAYRQLKIAEGEWSPEHQQLFEEVIEAEELGRTINPRRILKFFPVIKAQYWGPLKYKGLALTAFHKYSLMPIIPTVAKNKNVKLLHDKMMKENIAYLTFESGSKVSTLSRKSGADPLYKENRTLDLDTPFTKNTIHLEYLKNQLAIHDEAKGKIIFSTQLRKLVEDGLMEGGVPIDFKPELSFDERVSLWEATEDKEGASNMYKLVRAYEGKIQELTEYQKDRLLKEMNWTRGMVEGSEAKDMKSLMEFVYTQLSREDLADHELDFLEMSNGKIKWDLSLSFSADKIEKLLNALLVNRLVKQKVNGEGLIQVASTLFEDINGAEDYNWTNATEADNKKYNGSNDLPTYYRGEDGITRAMKVKVALQGQFTNLLDLTHTDGERIRNLERLNEVIKDDAWLDMEGKRHREMITMVGVRIPVQGLNSMEVMEVYEFLPAEAGSIIIPPSEIVAKSGADFDVDKLTVMMPNIRRAKRTAGQVTVEPQMWNYNDQELKDAYDYYVNKKAEAEGFVKEDLADAIFSELGLWNYDDGFTPQSLKNELVEMLQEEGKVTSFEEFKKRMLSDKAIQNDLLGLLKDMLTLPENFRALITPNSTDILYRKGDNTSLAENLKDDVLDYNPLDVINGETRKGDKGQDVISPTRVLEIGYNLYKHNSNAIGKQTLGLGAVDNTYNSLFNRIGFHLNPTIGVSTAEYNDLVQRRNQGEELSKADLIKINGYKRQTFYLDHNTKDVNKEKAISLSHLKDANQKYYISDVINQLMNGWVDIAKDTWIFNIQGNKELSPVLLFMVQAGVPIDQAVYFVSMPLVREYVKHQRKYKSTFSENLGYEIEDKNYFRSEAARRILLDQRNGFEVPVDKIKDNKYKGGLKELGARILKPYVDENGNFKASKLRKAISNAGSAMRTNQDYAVTEMDRAAFLHFLEIQEMAKAVTEVKMKMNVDTSKDGSLFEAQNRIIFKNKLKADGRFPSEMIEKLENESPIGSFFIQEFQIDVLGDAFPLRNNPYVNEEIMSVVTDRKLSEQFIENQFNGDAERFAKAYKADLPVYLFQNAIRGVNITDLKSYNGYKVKKATVKKVKSLEYGAYVEDGILYIDENELNRQYINKSYKAGSKLNKELGIAAVNSLAFHKPEEFFKFAIERALLRDRYSPESIQNDFEFQNLQRRVEAKYSKRENESAKDFEFRKTKSAYEMWLRNKALDNSFNHWKMFKSQDTYVQQFFRLIDKHDDLAAYFSVINALTIQTHGSGFKNLTINDSKMDGDQINVIYENIQNLSSHKSLKEILPHKTNQEIVEITDFFSRMPVVAYLQSGANTTGKYSLVRFVNPTNVYTVISSEVNKLMKHFSQKDYVKTKTKAKSRSKVLVDYLQQFGTVHNQSSRPSQIRGKDYFTGMRMTQEEGKKKVTIEKGLDEESLDLSYPLSLGTKQLKAYNPQAEDLVQMAEQNPELVFIYNNAYFDQVTGGAPQRDARLAFANVASIGLPTKAMFKDKTLQEGIDPAYFPKSSIIRDKDGAIDSEIKEAIDSIIDEMLEAQEQGKVLVFNTEGYGQDMLEFKKDSDKRYAPQTFLYLSKRLLEVGFVNPGYIKSDQGRQEVQSYQDVSDVNIKEANDQAVKDFMNHCMNI